MKARPGVVKIFALSLYCLPMLLRKSFQFRLRPTKKQEKAMQAYLDECRWLYNELLEQRKLAYEDLDITLSKYQQQDLLPLLKQEENR
jgi:putative transposase